MTNFKFNVGDLVTPMCDKIDDSGRVVIRGKCYRVDHPNLALTELNKSGYEDWCFSQPFSHDQFVLFTPSQPTLMSSVLDFIKDKARTSDERALIRAGLMTTCGDLTQEGGKVLLALLFKDKMKDMAEVAKDKVAEDEKSKK